MTCHIKPWSRAGGGAVSALVLAVATGCGTGGDVERFDVSGEVTYGGNSVPVGFISFTPDASAGNRGPAAGASIENGRFRTPDGQGVVGGPHIVEITGSDGVSFASPEGPQAAGRPLFPTYETRLDLRHEDAELDLEVPLRYQMQAP